MKTVKTLWLVFTLLQLSVGLFGQDTKSKMLSYTFSFIPTYLTSYHGEFSFRTIPINFEANIHYKPGNRISYTTGIGYFRKAEDHFVVWTTPNEYFYEETVSNIRFPIQFNYHIIKSPKKTDCYLKAEFTNGIFSRRIEKYERYEQVNDETRISYQPSVGIGIGNLFLRHKRVGIILEGTIEKYLRSESSINSTGYPIYETTWYSMKVGIVF
jgi:hypothetical protein